MKYPGAKNLILLAFYSRRL